MKKNKQSILITGGTGSFGREFARRVLDQIQPTHDYWTHKEYASSLPGSKACPDGFCYASDTNSDWLQDAQIAELVRQTEGHLPSDMPRADEPRFIKSS